MTLANATVFSTLLVCEKCGWPMAGPYETATHRSSCPHVKAGANAKALADRFPELSSTKFGYGTGQLTFELDENLHVTFRCDKKTFQLQDLYLLGNLTADEAAGLVEAIADWRSNCIRARSPRTRAKKRSAKK
jgi:hypothetical protein